MTHLMDIARLATQLECDRLAIFGSDHRCLGRGGAVMLTAGSGFFGGWSAAWIEVETFDHQAVGLGWATVLGSTS